MNEMFAVTIPGNPIPKARPRVIVKDGKAKVHAYTPKRTKDYEEYVKELIIIYWRDAPLTCPLSVRLLFYRENRIQVDIDNLAKSILDALQGVVFENDNQIEILHLEKYADETSPRVEIELTYSEAKEQDGELCRNDGARLPK